MTRTSTPQKVAKGKMGCVDSIDVRGTNIRTNTVKVGRRLSVRAGRWLSGTTVTYRWTIRGKVVTHSAKRTFTARRSRAGKKLGVTAIGHTPGFFDLPCRADAAPFRVIR